MSTFNPSADKGGATPEHWQDSTRHTKEDALSEREWELLWEGAQSLEAPYDLDAQLVVMAGGRLGLRAGEIAHLCEDWIDWQTDTIQIPHHDSCDFGRDGGICGYCRRCARQRVARGGPWPRGVPTPTVARVGRRPNRD
jgi:integrase